MNKEEYIIKINEEEIKVDKEIYNLFLPLGKIIEDLSNKYNELQNNWNELKDFIKEQYILIENEKRSNYIDGCYDELGVIAMKVEEIERRKNNEM